MALSIDRITTTVKTVAAVAAEGRLGESAGGKRLAGNR